MYLEHYHLNVFLVVFYVDLYVYIESMSLRIVGSTVQALTQQRYWKITR